MEPTARQCEDELGCSQMQEVAAGAAMNSSSDSYTPLEDEKILEQLCRMQLTCSWQACVQAQLDPSAQSCAGAAVT